jgi:hypothetical protein
MFQPYTEQPRRSTFVLRLKAGATWLVHLGIFAGLVWLPARRPEQPAMPSAIENPKEDGEEQGWIRKQELLQFLPLLDSDPRCSWPNDEAVPYFRGPMTSPVLIYGAQLPITAKGPKFRAPELVIVRCIITCRGEVTQCSVLKGPPHMNQAVIAMLESRRYYPVLYQGQPTSVSYNFHVRVEPL